MTNTLRIMRALALALAAATAALSACAGSFGEPKTAPPVSSSPASASSPTPAAADVPAEAKLANSAGAEAFARYVYGQIKLAFDTKNPDLISALSAPSCKGCARFIASVTKLRDNNERVENFVFKIMLAVAPAVTGDTARVDASWSSPEVIRYDANGKVINREGPFVRVDDEINLARRGDSWVVTELHSLRVET